VAARQVDKIDEEQVLPHPPLGWPGLDPGEIDPPFRKDPEDLVQEAGLVFFRVDEDAALGAALLLSLRPCDPDEPGGIARVVLNIPPEERDLVEIGRHPGDDSSRTGRSSKFTGTCRVAAGVDDRDLQLIRNPAALLMGLGMGVDHGDRVKRGESGKMVMDRHVEFGGDIDLVLEQPVKRGTNPTRLAVLNRHQSVAKPLLNHGKDLVDGRGKEDLAPVDPYCEFMGEGSLRSQHDERHRCTIAVIR